MTKGLAPIIAPGARVLILGSLPSRLSLEKQQYYGNPQNAFWRIMGELFSAGPELCYAGRKRNLLRNRVALWDVLATSVRPGSMDSAIDFSSAAANDFTTLLREQGEIATVCFNGRVAAKLFERLVAPGLKNRPNSIDYKILPSTSPAYASMRFAEKLQRWNVVRTATGNN